MIQFLLNRELRSERALDPNTTVLQYLREYRGKTGTKEGCASGDCGACTVVVGELVDDRLRYRTLNSCLTFVSALHGKQLISVEDLKDQGRLHSVQQAMVDCHGSQCGFCTPGFVASLFALQKNAGAVNEYDPQAHEALAGNLCRCTGYRPILEAAEQACCAKQPDQFDAREAETIAQLKAIAPREMAELSDGERCLSPLTVAELAEVYAANPDARLLAGGTDLALEVTQFHRELPVMIHVGQITEMKQVRSRTAISRSVRPPADRLLRRAGRRVPGFRRAAAALRLAADPQPGRARWQHRQRLPDRRLAAAADRPGCRSCPAQGRQQPHPLEDYFIDYYRAPAREFIEKVRVPRATPDRLFRAYKVSKRLDDDISAVCAAFDLQITDGVVADARVAFGGMAALSAPRPARRP